MPAWKGWAHVAAVELYWTIYEHAPRDIRAWLHLDFHGDRIYVFAEGYPPARIFGLFNDDFFLRWKIKSTPWEQVFRFSWESELWVPFDPSKHSNFPGGWCGWRYHESLIIPQGSMEVGEEVTSASPGLEPPLAKRGNGEAPSVVRKIMD